VLTVGEFDVPRAEQQELLGLLAPMRGDIVEAKSPETGTPLPRMRRRDPLGAVSWE